MKRMGFTTIIDDGDTSGAGTLVPDEAIQLLCELERQDVDLWVAPGDVLYVSPMSKVSAAQRLLIARYRSHMIYLVARVVGREAVLAGDCTVIENVTKFRQTSLLPDADIG